MFHLRDFFHHPSIQSIIERLRNPEPGLILVSGGDGLPHQALAAHLGMEPGEGLLPSGRGVIFRALLEELLEAQPAIKVVRVAESAGEARRDRRNRSRLETIVLREDAEVAATIRTAAARMPDLLILEKLPRAGLVAALAAATDRPVVGQVDCPLPASAVPHALGMSGAAGWHPNLRWVVAVQRLPALCPHCREAHTLTAEEKDWLQHAVSDQGVLSGLPLYDDGPFYTAPGCEKCQESGRNGDVALLEVRYNPPDGRPLQCLLSIEAAIWHLVQRSGNSQLSLSDLIFWQAENTQRAYQALARMQQALDLSLKTQKEQRSEIEAAKRVLEQRTQALFSLQNLGQALISSNDLGGLGRRICQRAAELCGGDLAVLYYLRDEEQAEILAVNGWPNEVIGQLVTASEILNWSRSAEPAPYQGLPPGLQTRREASAAPLNGLYVPLIAQHARVGALVLQSAKQKVFHPGQVALLQTFANQAALALQRADLVDELRAKITELEAAQAGLARKERLESEMELARQVQQSFLPRYFPEIPGLAFAARYQAARQVGGDFYDAFALPDGQIGLAVADVSDKGMPAALYMALTRSLLLAEARRESSPSLVLQRVNQLLHDLGSSKMFVTVFYATLDPDSYALRYARAGHERPVILHNGELMTLAGKGLPLGIFTGEDFYLEEHTTHLKKGDRLVMYSDGLPDAHAPGGEMYQRSHLLDLLIENATLPADELCNVVFEEILKHQQGNSPFDDMTLLVMQVA